MLKDTFYSLSDLQMREGTVSGFVTLNPDHVIYDGHFPGKPVTPGVCQIQIIKEVISDLLGYQVYLVEAKNIKFLNVLTPEVKKIKLEIDYAKDGNGFKVNAMLSLGASVFLKFTGRFQKIQPMI
jgi:3-hydroxyacyl-[acyl-carrier-protein] dehydratase